jgi:putative ABC transport system ATP-binding protein
MSAVAVATDGTPALLHLEHVSKSYRVGDGRVSALRDVHLKLHHGEFIALKGPSGSGKTTLLNICGLLDTLDMGRYVLAGEDTARLSQRQLALLRRRLIGFVFQGFNLVPVMTAYENVEYPLLLAGMPAAQRKQRVTALLQRVGLAEFAKHRPDHLSGGQRQRVAVARALVKQPSLVIADEPTANLDTDTARHVIDLMHELGKLNHTTFLIATHDERMAARCDRTLTMLDGVLQ